MAGQAALAVASLISAGVGYKGMKAAEKQRDEQKKEKKNREAQLAAEEAARVAAVKEAEGIGRKAGTGAPSMRQTFLSTARGGTTGFSTAGTTPREDVIGRATLFGN